MPFITDINLNFIDGANQLTDPEPVQYKFDATSEVFTIPPEFASDGASIPKLLWWRLGHPFDKSHRDEAYLHDYLCKNGRDFGLSRSKADLIFRTALLEAKRKPTWRCWEFWMGVRIGAYFGVGVPK